MKRQSGSCPSYTVWSQAGVREQTCAHDWEGRKGSIIICKSIDLLWIRGVEKGHLSEWQSIMSSVVLLESVVPRQAQWRSEFFGYIQTFRGSHRYNPKLFSI